MAKGTLPKPNKIGDPHFKGATPATLARALMRRVRPIKPTGKSTDSTGTHQVTYIIPFIFIALRVYG